jgi:uncharacterized tellurite resistance protein B-like protein
MMLKNLFNTKNLSQVSKENDELDVVLRLMFEIAISDGALDKAELEIIRKKAKELNTEEKTNSSIIKRIIDDSEKSTSIYSTVKKINEDYSQNEKLELLTSLWALVAADKKIDPYEENLYFKIADLIKIKRSLANQIKQKNIKAY